MVKRYYSSSSLSLSLLLLLLLILASSLLLFAVSSLAEQATKGAQNNSTDEKVRIVPKRHVRITNDLGQGVVLKVRCKSKDDDLGIHYLSFHDTYEWKFRSNAFIRNTLFYCYMWWGNNVRGSFDVYDATRDDNECTKCRWSIRSDGAYWFNAMSSQWDLRYQWPKP